VNRRSIIALVAALLGAAVLPAAAQDYPTKPIRIISPYSAGGGNDAMSRLVAERLTLAWGQNVVVENRPGGNTMIANEMVAKAPADGYTLIMNGDGVVTNPYFYSKVPYDVLKDLAPVAIMGFSQLVLVANPNVPAKDARELVALAKAKPNSLNFGTSGQGGPDHLTILQFNQLAGVNIALIPYKGSSMAINDLVGGQVQLMITPLAAVQPFVKAGKLRLLAFATTERSPQYPEVQTLAEAGVPNYDAYWHGLMAPAGTPPRIVARLADEIRKIHRQPDVQEKFRAMGVVVPDEAQFGAPEKFGAMLREKLARNGEVARKASVRPE